MLTSLTGLFKWLDYFISIHLYEPVNFLRITFKSFKSNTTTTSTEAGKQVFLFNVQLHFYRADINIVSTVSWRSVWCVEFDMFIELMIHSFCIWW